jgi:hypothetical protein
LLVVLSVELQPALQMVLLATSLTVLLLAWPGDKAVWLVEWLGQSAVFLITSRKFAFYL